MSFATRTEHPYIVVDPTIRGGRPTIVGTRIGVDLLARFLRAGEGPDEILAMYPHLTSASVYDALSYYFDHQPEIDRLIADDSPERVLERHGASVDETGRMVFAPSPERRR
ncbi:MAG: DUF433 domain-containing protein [Chloroflexota bacterium]|nr:DUF433 domain-containing protein [Chloroflexota bacterium]